MRRGQRRRLLLRLLLLMLLLLLHELLLLRLYLTTGCMHVLTTTLYLLLRVRWRQRVAPVVVDLITVRL